MNAITVVENGAFSGTLPLAVGPNAQVICQSEDESPRAFASRVVGRAERLSDEPEVKTVQYFFSNQQGLQLDLARQRVARALLETLVHGEVARMIFCVEAQGSLPLELLSLIEVLREELVRQRADRKVEFSLQCVAPPSSEGARASAPQPKAVVSAKRPAAEQARELRISA